MILEVDQHFPQPGIVEHAVEILKENHGIIVYPTDTVYGLGCDITDKEAIKKIDVVKKREKGKFYSIICKDLAQIRTYANITKEQEKILNEYLPGPFTFIIKAKNTIPKRLQNEFGTIGVRIPRNRLCKALVKKLGKPLITTSFNVSGKDPITDPENIPKELLKKIDVVLDAEELGNIPSTVVDLTQKTPKVLRKGFGKFN